MATLCTTRLGIGSGFSNSLLQGLRSRAATYSHHWTEQGRSTSCKFSDKLLNTYK